jgi:hypothetical protein
VSSIVKESDFMNGMIEELITITRNQLERYVDDEIGQDEKDKYKNMSNLDILYLLIETLQYEISLNRNIDDIKDMFESDLIYQFNIGGY